VEAAGRTNYVKDSTDFDPGSTNWTSVNGTSVGAAVQSILKGESAYPVSVNAAGDLRQAAGSFTGSEETVSLLVEEGAASKFRVILSGGDADKALDVAYEWGTGATVVIGARANARVLTTNSPNRGKRLVRLVLSYDPTAANNGSVEGETRRYRIVADDARNGDDIVLHHAQLEEAPNATNPIVTGASATTRAADDYKIFSGGAPSWFSGTEGTWVLHISPQAYNLTVGNRVLDFDNDIDLYFASVTSPPFRFQAFDGTNVVKGSTNVNPFSDNKIAASFTTSEVRLSTNGVSDSGTYNGSAVQNVSSVTLCPNSFALFSKVVYFPRALSESKLNTLTS